MTDTFQTRSRIEVEDRTYHIHSLAPLRDRYDVDRLPYALKVLLENLLRNEDGDNVTRQQIEALLNWDPAAEPSQEIAFTPARVLLQDFTGVPAVVDLAAMRDAMSALGKDP
ncbi:MAG: aconitate hydratase, partial [Ectothiorhodospira sp.]